MTLIITCIVWGLIYAAAMVVLFALTAAQGRWAEIGSWVGYGLFAVYIVLPQRPSWSWPGGAIARHTHITSHMWLWVGVVVAVAVAGFFLARELGLIEALSRWLSQLGP